MWGIGIGILFVLMVVAKLLYKAWEDRQRAPAPPYVPPHLDASAQAPMGRCNVCGYPYRGLALDCYCTMCPSCGATRRDDRREGCNEEGWHRRPR
jgi:hypothetical protein